jgi:hypothetical protein
MSIHGEYSNQEPPLSLRANSVDCGVGRTGPFPENHMASSPYILFEYSSLLL